MGSSELVTGKAWGQGVSHTHTLGRFSLASRMSFLKLQEAANDTCALRPKLWPVVQLNNQFKIT